MNRYPLKLDFSRTLFFFTIRLGLFSRNVCIISLGEPAQGSSYSHISSMDLIITPPSTIFILISYSTVGRRKESLSSECNVCARKARKGK